MVKKNSIFIFFLITSLQFLGNEHTYANHVKKAYKHINEGKYEAAWPILEKTLEKEPENFAAHFLMSRYYYMQDNRKFNLDSAYIHADKALALFKNTDSKKSKNKYAPLGIRRFTLNLLLTDIGQLAFEIADSSNTLDSWEYFIGRFTKASQISQAIERRNKIAYDMALEEFTYQSFKEFMDKYSNAAQISDAKRLYESLLYKNKTRAGTLQAYKAFLDDYPDSPYFNEAKQQYEIQLFRTSIEKGNLKSYIDFTEAYPESPYTGIAQDSIYTFATSGNSIMEFERFIHQFPSNRNIDRAWLNLYELFNMKRTSVVFERFKSRYPEFPFPDKLEHDRMLAKRQLIPFEVNGSYGYRDSTTNDTVIPATFTEVYPFSEGLASVSLEECTDQCMYGYIDKDGKTIIPPRFNEAGDFIDGLALVGIGDCYNDECLYGFINRLGEEVIPIEYDDAFEFSDGVALVKKEAPGYGYVNRQGNVQIPLQFKDAGSFSSGMAAVNNDTAWGYIDLSGEMVIMPQFKMAGAFKNGLAPVAVKQNLWGYIDAQGKFLIKPQFAYASPFDNDTARVLVKEKVKGVFVMNEKLIDINGNFVQ